MSARKSGRDPSGQALVASDQAASRLAPLGFDPSRNLSPVDALFARSARFIDADALDRYRYSPGLGLCGHDRAHINYNTLWRLVDTIDALEASAIEARRAETAETGSVEDESAVPNGETPSCR